MPCRDLPWRKWIPWIVGMFCILLLIALILPAIQQAREAARRSSSKSNLKELGLAFHNYHDVYELLPPGSVITQDGTAMHGWESAILPYLDSAPVYNYIDFDYSWDDPVNLHVFRYWYPVLLNPVLKAKMTEEGFFLNHYSANSALFHLNSSISFEDLDAGASNVWMASELFDAWQPWGAPFYWHDLEWPVKIAEDEDGWSAGGAYALLADGSVRYYGVDEDVEELRNASPVVTAERTKQENLNWKYLPMPGTPSRVNARADDTIFRYYMEASYDPNITLEQVRKELIRSVQAQWEDKPDASVFNVKQLDLDDETLPLILQFKQLECLRVRNIALSEDGLNQLANLRSLKIIMGWGDAGMASRLRETMPDCELRFTIIDQDL